MTEPPDAEPMDPADSNGDEHDEVVLRLRELLREEPIEVDELARERRLRAALDAAPGGAPVPVPRRTASAPWLTAAAVIVLVALGGYLLFSVAGSGGGEDESADSGAEAVTAGSDPAAPTASDGSGSQDAGSGAGGAADADLSTTTAPAFEATSGAAGIADLGEFPDAAALRLRLGAELDEHQSSARSAPPPDATKQSPAISECIAARQAAGAEVLGFASIDGDPVVVIRAPEGVDLLAIPGCTARPD